MLSGKRVVITGGAGFIGSSLARALVDQNEVVAVDNRHRDTIDGTALMAHPQFSFVEADVCDQPAVTDACRGATHVVHCAAIAGVDDVLESPVRVMTVNMLGTHAVLEAALATMSTIERVVEFSTSEVYGARAANVDEGTLSVTGTVGEARWTYAVSKLAGEHLSHAFASEFGLPVVTVRPFNVYGPGQVGGGAIRAFVEQALAGKDLAVHGRGSQIRAWCFIDDMVRALLLMLERPEAIGQVFNVGNERSVVSIFDLAQRIARMVGDVSVFRVEVPPDWADVEVRIPNVDKARDLLGWEPVVDLDDGLTRTIAWYRAGQYLGRAVA
jgi:UDP-glucose 4-epimerase